LDGIGLTLLPNTLPAYPKLGIYLYIYDRVSERDKDAVDIGDDSKPTHQQGLGGPKRLPSIYNAARDIV
jgi:hypothetical protein